MSDTTDAARVLKICDDALALEGDRREEFLEQACQGDEKLRASVDSVLIAVSDAGGFLAMEDSGAADSALIGEKVGAFRVIEKLGEGGMGAVYLAEREGGEFEQRVAIKMVRGHMMARALVDRFQAERKILASLNHPYIAALIDGGATKDGAPYLVMEYVEGVPIDRYCDEKSLGIEARLSLLQKVATAVHAAHQNLIVHRDLKPSNVLVTADGIPKLLDFGIAKLLDPDAGSDSGNTTVFGQRAMTPNYASPEQVLDGRVTTASDVYSLGVLAYHLLSGGRPYDINTATHKEMISSFEALTVPRASARLDASSESELDTIASQRATTPTRLRRQLAGDLDNILGKALQKDPSRRYASVAAFSADLGRFMDGLPIEARADSVAYRFSRFVGRHKFGVAASIGALALLLGGLGATWWAYLGAERARAIANERFEQVRSIAKTLMFEVFDDIERVPGTNSARQTLAVTAQSYLEALADVPGASADVQLEAAQGYYRLSHIFNRQAVRDAANRELAADARAKSRALLETLRETHPEPEKVHRTLANLQSDVGNYSLYLDNDPAAARAELTESLASFERAQSAHAGDPEFLAERYLAAKRMVDTYKWENELEEAEQRAGGLLQEIAAARETTPEHAGLVKTHADALVMRSEVRNFSGQHELATEDLADAIELYRRHIEIDGQSLAIDNALVIAYWMQGTALTQLGRGDEGIESLDNALDLLAVQIARDPTDVNISRRIAIMKGTKSQALADVERYDDALAIMMEANEWFEAQVQADPDTPTTHRGVAVGYQVIADLMRDAGRDADACQWWQRTLDKWQEIDDRFGISEFDAGEPDKLREQMADCP